MKEIKRTKLWQVNLRLVDGKLIEGMIHQDTEEMATWEFLSNYAFGSSLSLDQFRASVAWVEAKEVPIANPENELPFYSCSVCGWPHPNGTGCLFTKEGHDKLDAKWKNENIAVERISHAALPKT